MAHVNVRHVLLVAEAHQRRVYIYAELFISIALLVHLRDGLNVFRRAAFQPDLKAISSVNSVIESDNQGGLEPCFNHRIDFRLNTYYFFIFPKLNSLIIV